MKLNKKILILALGVFTTVCILPSTVYASEFSSGKGTKSNPYIISNAQELNNVRNYCGEKYKDTYFKISSKKKKLDMSSISNFEPICDYTDGTDEKSVYSNAFYGHFDGSAVEIDNLKIDTNKISGGLFGATDGAEISNVGLGKNSSVTVHGKVESSGIGPAGGLVGSAWNTKFFDVWNDATIKSDHSQAGGIVGRLKNNSSIKNAENTGKVSAGKENDGGSLAGGIAGFASGNVTIENVSNKGDISGEGARVGGIVGNLQENSSLTNAFNNNQNIKGTECVGLIVGILPDDSYNALKNVYTIKENTNLNGIGFYNDKVTIEGIKGYTKEELKNKENFSGFDFNNIWAMKEYPVLKNINIIENGSGKPSNGNSAQIRFNDKNIDIENFITNEGRTYVELNKFCKVTNLCEVKYKEEKQEYTIIKNIEATGETINSKLTNENTNYVYAVYHKKGSKNFKPYIMIGKREIENNIAKQESDVATCPKNDKYKCDKNNFYVPVRFLTQSLGFRVEWDGNNSIINIKDSITSTFLSKYDVVTTTKKNCNTEDCIVQTDENKKDKNDNFTYVEANKKYYLNIIDKETKERKKFYRLYSFYGNFELSGELGNPTFKDGLFTIHKDELSVDSRKSNNDLVKNIAQIIIYEIKESDKDYKTEDFNAGGYPIIINNIFYCENCK